MKLNVPSSENLKKRKRKKILNFLVGLVIGIIIFGLGSVRLFGWGMEEVEMYTWLVPGFGILSFGFLEMIFGNSFWRSILDLFSW